jgi:hypothetical protein
LRRKSACFPPIRTRPPFALGAVLTVLVAGMLLLGGCEPSDAPGAVVVNFIQARYLANDFKSSEQWCTGLALAKLHKEEAAAGQNTDAAARKPAIHYRLDQKRDGDDRVIYVFVATVDAPDGRSFDKKWMITARKEGDIWKVSNYSEYD